ncbi:MAG: isoprenylcysteine carboxylmethyltransferase family protein [Gammaproteobacteria bacterium]|jgi:protein-S-isoprenylcysteine O-methyltransferase Ste14|nr:isoprenylcysteine carboxylmethyltransferase family protein [Gammaproteobacteria bacterium]
MQRGLILLFGIVTYLFFFVAFLYFIAFVGNLQTTALADAWPALATLVPYSVSFGREAGSPALAVAINLGLIALFGAQHSIMARSGFKSWLARHLPRSAERSVYVLFSTALLVLLMWQWRPMGPVLWSVDAAGGQAILWTLFAAGFAMVFVATFLIDHFDLFGLKQVWSQFRNRAAQPPPFVTPLFYRIVRHPLYLGFLIAFWAAPLMTVGHLIFAAGMTVYILIGVSLEERDLVGHLGEDYQRYRRKVPKLIPVPGRAWRDDDAAQEPESASQPW